MDAAPETQEPKPPPRRWWLRMIVASAALVAVLLGAYFLPPVVELHYYARRWRRGFGGEEDLVAVVECLRARGASPDAFREFLGKPHEEKRRKNGDLVLRYSVPQPLDARSSEDVALLINLSGKDLVFRGGRLIAIEPWSRGILFQPEDNPLFLKSDQPLPPQYIPAPEGQEIDPSKPGVLVPEKEKGGEDD